MEMYICEYESGAALKIDLYSVAQDLFRYVLSMGHAFLCEVPQWGVQAGVKDRKPRREKEAREALNVQVAASMAGKQVAFAELAELAERVGRRDLEGERALEDQLLLCFWEAGLAARIDDVVLDILHVMEYLREAGTALHGEKGQVYGVTLYGSSGRVEWKMLLQTICFWGSIAEYDSGYAYVYLEASIAT